MATIKEVCRFTTKADQVQFHTQTNGDSVHIKNLILTRDQATTLAWLVNTDNNATLVFRIKIKGT